MKLAAARKNGTVMAFRLNGDTNDDVQSVDVRCQRFKPGHRFVGLDTSYRCDNLDYTTSLAHTYQT